MLVRGSTSTRQTVDPSQQRYMKSQSGAADESSQAGYMLTGGLVLIVGGIVLLAQAQIVTASCGTGSSPVFLMARTRSEAAAMCCRTGKLARETATWKLPDGS